MKKLVLAISLIVVLVAGLAMTGCIRRDLTEKNGPITVQSFNNTGFTGIDIGSAMKLEVTRGDSYNVTITAGKTLFDHIKVEQTGDTLKISTDGWSFSWWWGHTTPKVTITMPSLEKLYMSGATDGTITGFKSSKDFTLKTSGASRLNMDMETGLFTAEISGASDVHLNIKAVTFQSEASGASNLTGNIDTANSDIELSGASDARLTGSGGDLKLVGSGASSGKLTGYSVDNADVNLSGASDADISVSVKLDVTVSGASTLNYYGNPILGKTDITGSSDLNHKTQ